MRQEKKHFLNQGQTCDNVFVGIIQNVYGNDINVREKYNFTKKIKIKFFG